MAKHAKRTASKSAVGTTLVALMAASLLATPASASGRASRGDTRTESFVSGTLTGVSCTSATTCTAVGTDAFDEAFYVSQTARRWGDGTEIGGGGRFTAVSCASPSTCTATGSIGGSVYASDVNGVWMAGPKVQEEDPESFTSYADVSCTTASDCTAAGLFGVDIHSFPLLETEADGQWSNDAFGWPTFGALTAVSCTSATACTAVGNDGDGEGGAGAPTYVSEDDDVWGNAGELAGASGGYFRGISCTSSADCVGIGIDGSGTAFYVTDEGGVWGAPVDVAGPPSSLDLLNGVSCADALDCTIVGDVVTKDGSDDPVSLTERAGTWGALTTVSVAGGTGTLTSVSCATASTCTAVGEDGLGRPIVVTETGNAWGAATEVSVTRTVPTTPQDVAVVAGEHSATVRWRAPTYVGTGGPVAYAVHGSPGTATCSTFATHCTLNGLTNGTAYAISVSATNAVGTGPPGAALLPIIPGVPVRVRLFQSQATVVYGAESSERLVVAVASKDGGTPVTGRVQVLVGSTYVCSITVHRGVGACLPSSTVLDAGPYVLDAVYMGDSVDATASAPGKTLTVFPEVTSDTVNLSRVSIRTRSEAAETFTATVIPWHGGSPSGTVSIVTGGQVLCSMSLSHDSGSCSMRASELPPGTYEVRATYAGGVDFKDSRSTVHALTITT